MRDIFVSNSRDVWYSSALLSNSWRVCVKQALVGYTMSHAIATLIVTYIHNALATSCLRPFFPLPWRSPVHGGWNVPFTSFGQSMKTYSVGEYEIRESYAS